MVYISGGIWYNYFVIGDDDNINKMGNEMRDKKVITLEGKTRHGKNRIREHGATWSIEEIKVSPAPSALFVKSLKSGVKRWIDQPTDEHFDVVAKKESRR